MAADNALEPITVDTGQGGLQQSRHHPLAGNAQFAPTDDHDTEPANGGTHETPEAVEIKDMKEWKFLLSLVTKNGTKIAVTAAAKDLLQVLQPANTTIDASGKTARTNHRNNKNSPPRANTDPQATQGHQQATTNHETHQETQGMTRVND
jgi:hypothetical protein